MVFTLRTNSDIIAIAGLKNSGKDTAAKMLNYLLNAPKPFRTYKWYKLLKNWPFKKKWKITSFAKPLKQTLSIILNQPLEWFDDRFVKEHMYVNLDNLDICEDTLLDETDILSENKFSKLIKTGEPFPQDTWLSVRQLMQWYGTQIIRKYIGDSTWINATLKTCVDKPTIISDLRFIVEYNRVKALNGKVWYITNSNCVPGSHASEYEVIYMENHNMFDEVIVNNSTLEDLFNTIKRIIYK